MGTPQASRADQLVLDIALAYSRLGPAAHRSLVAFMTGDHSIRDAHETALLIAATTSQQDLVLILARLLVMVDDEVGAQEHPCLSLLNRPSQRGIANPMGKGRAERASRLLARTRDHNKNED